MIYVFIVFLIFLVMGVPVAFAIGASGMVFFLLNTHFPLTHIAQLPFNPRSRAFPCLPSPLFILAGNLMNNGGVTKRLVSLATLLTGHMRGGLAQTSVVLSTLMGGVSGSATADAAMEARLLGPDMIKKRIFQGVLCKCPYIHLTDYCHDSSGGGSYHIRHYRQCLHRKAFFQQVSLWAYI